MRAGLDGLDTFTVQEPEQRWLEACQSPVWDTALATLIALADGGLEPDDPALVRAAEWLLERQVSDVGGDWALQASGPASRRVGVRVPQRQLPGRRRRRGGRARPAPRRPPRSRARRQAVGLAVEWMIGMQCGDGGWGAFDVDNTRALRREVPFCDFGEVIDPPSADVTAHAVELLAAEAGRVPATRRRRPALAARRAGARRLVVRALGRQPHLRHVVGAVRAGSRRRGCSDERRARAVDWLEQHQNADGGWGEDCRSYDDPDWIGRGDSTPSQTAWALIGLHAVGASGLRRRRAGCGGCVRRSSPRELGTSPSTPGRVSPATSTSTTTSTG